MKYIIFGWILLSVIFKPVQGYSDTTIVEEWTVDISEDGYVEQRAGIDKGIGPTDEENYARRDLKARISTYKKMQKAGGKLGAVGGGMLLLGIILTASTDWEKETIQGQKMATTKERKGVVGVVLIVSGGPMSLVALILGGVGSGKVEEYKKQLKDITINFEFSPQKNGVKLCYDF